MAKGERGTAKPTLRGKIWWIKYYVPGETEPRRESSKSTNKNDAVRLLNQRRSEIDNRKVTSTSATVGDLLKLYLSDQRQQKRSGLDKADGYVRLHLEPAFGKVKASAITTQMVRSFIDRKLAAEYKNATINRWLEALQRAYTLGQTEVPPLVYTAPEIKALMLDESGNVREGFLDHDQYVRMRNELPDHQRLVLVIAFHLGMRRGEILKLRWDQVDWTANLIRLEKKQTKAKQARIAPLYGELRAWLDMAYSARQEGCPFIVSYEGHGVSELKTAWNTARVRAGVDELMLHDMRRTAARNMVRAGIPEKQIQLIGGWKSRSIFDRYNIIDERDVHSAGEKMARFAQKNEAAAAGGATGASADESRHKSRHSAENEEKVESAKVIPIQ